MAAAAQEKKWCRYCFRLAGHQQKDTGGYTALLKALGGKKDDVAELLVTQPKLEVNARGEDGYHAVNALRLAQPRRYRRELAAKRARTSTCRNTMAICSARCGEHREREHHPPAAG